MSSDLLLLGTGSADGWPNPWCPCASCAAAARAGVVRGQTSALLDGRVLLDCGPETGRAAVRAGSRLTEVGLMLLTHAHPDHTAPAALLWRSWAQARRPLLVAGPSAALEACAPWVGPTDSVELRELRAGDELTWSGYVIRALPAAHGGDGVGEALLFDVTGPDGDRLLYATDTGPLPAQALRAVRDRAYDVVALEATFGTHEGHGTDHLDLTTFAGTLAELRRRAACVDTTHVVAVHLGHRNPPPAELDRRLHLLGATAGRDGQRLPVRRALAADRTGPGERLPGPGRVLITGGARSGKSHEAERRLAAEPSVTYVATSRPLPGDLEWEQRIAAHRKRRPAHWSTVETTDLVSVLRADDPEPVLIDCLTLWLADLLEQCGQWDAEVEPQGSRRVSVAIDALVEAWRTTGRTVVAVTNEVGSGVVPATVSGRMFRDALGQLNARLAELADETWVVVAGRALPLP